MESAAKIRVATPADAELVSAILTEAARWLEKSGIPLWQENELAADKIATEITQQLFFIAECSGDPAGVVRFQPEDSLFWPDVPEGEAAYVHRLAVRRRYAGTGVSKVLLRWAVERTGTLGRRFLRLDCDAARPRLREMYESFGFRHRDDRQVGSYFVARYEYEVCRGSKQGGNPWLSIPLSEYERHMNSPEVQQSEALSELFAEAIGRCRPSSVAILGIAGGNGIERVNHRVISRIVGLDLNRQYLEVVRQRYSHLRGLELHCIDLSQEHVELEPVQLVHAALIFEHTGVDLCLENALSMIAHRGRLSIVLQLPAEVKQTTITSRFASIENLRSHFTLVDPRRLHELLESRSFRLIHETTRPLRSGTRLWLGIFASAKER